MRIFHKECKSLTEGGYEVVLIAPDQQDRVVDGVHIKAIRKPKSRIVRMTLGAWRVYRKAVRQQAELYHFHDPELLSVGLLLRARGAKIIYDIHEDLPRTMAYKFYLPTWLRRLLVPVTEWLENAGAARLSALVVATPLLNTPGWDRVDNLGYIPRDRVADVLGRTRVGLVVIHPQPNYIRSRPTKLFEYMAAGVPVIASDFPDWRKIIDAARCGLLVPPEDPRAIATAMEYLLTHPEEAREMGLRGRQAVEGSYVWDVEKKTLLDLYDSLLTPKRSAELLVPAWRAPD
ncbi:MAG: hypothetical protein DMG32_01175 [Acidobacteria bacterium]|nr:MAG: hypothetical protein DMG32_01175 [Acidobacteriota bacterium]